MPYSLYLHIPFCRHRCAYCDFNTYAGLDALVEPYMAALGREVRYLAGRVPEPVHTIFLGGGTPSLVPIPLLSGLFDAIRASFTLTDDAEITLEANPGTVSQDYLAGLRAMGVNRLSMGMQSASPDDLRILEREHTFHDVVNAATWGRRAGFTNISVDLIFGLPYQSLNSWAWTLELAIGLEVPHLSVYNLILEHGTPMNAWVERGLLREPDSDLAADMYEHAQARLSDAGFEQYEISNWARRDGAGRLLVCRHNLQYWRSLPYLGFGAGAHGFAGGVRTVNARAPRAYLERLSGETGTRPFPRTPATVNAASLSEEEEMGIWMMMGLRLVQEGVQDADFRSRFRKGLYDAFALQIDDLTHRGLLAWDGRTLRLTPKGVLFGNRVFMEFVA